MARGVIGSIGALKKSKRRRPGVHSKTKTSKMKNKTNKKELQRLQAAAEEGKLAILKFSMVSPY